MVLFFYDLNKIVRDEVGLCVRYVTLLLLFYKYYDKEN